MGTWAGVVRVSHMGARKSGAENVHADRDQVEAIRRHAAAHGAKLDILPPELDVSGGLPLGRRPSLLQAIEGVERGRYEAVIVAYLSRLGRNVQEQLKAWDRVENAGGRIICVREGIDTSTPHGRYVRTILLAGAEHEREVHVERFDNLRKWATMNGVWQRRQTPLGYTRGKDRRLHPDRDAARIRGAFRDRAAGVPVVHIARNLGMTPSGVRQLLQNRVYLGELRVGEYVNTEAHKPIVDPDLWHAAQRTQPRPARSGQPALCAGLLRCSACGHVMSRGGRGRAYICGRLHSGKECSRPAAVSAHLIEPVADNYGRWKWDQLVATPVQGDTAQDAREALTVAEQELATYLQAVSAQDVGAEAFGEGARLRRQAVDEARAGLDRELGKRLDIPEGVGWGDVPVHLRNQFLRDTLACIVVGSAGGRGGRTPLPERVRILEAGIPFVALEPIPLPDIPPALGIERFQDAPL